MGETIRLKAADGHEFDAYRAEPDGAPRGAVVVIQEIFGVNNHIRAVADGFAREGYLAIAPAIFDRIEPGIELGYTPDDITIGRDLKARGNAMLDSVLSDIQAARDAVAEAGKVGVVGYCWGGYLVWASACRLNFDAAVVYYGGGIVEIKDETPNCPIIGHFGKHDESIPILDVEEISNAHPTLSIYIYDAGHGFNCDQRASYDEEAAEAALKRTLEHFAEYLG